jgi:predicted TIM-barrel fold metal-dependent hydrolase
VPDFAIIDADGHVREPHDLWQRYMPAELQDRAPQIPNPDEPYIIIEGVEVPPRRSYAKTTKTLAAWHEDRYRFASEDHYSPASQLRAMDMEGIAASVLFPSNGLVLMGVDHVDPVITTAAARAYNTWLAEFCGEGNGRLHGAATLDPRDVDGAVVEAHRAVEELGLVAAYLRPNPVAGRPWHHPAYEPLWSTLEALGVAVCFHEGGAVMLPQVATDRFQEHAFWHACTHPMEQQMAMVSMLLGGVAERHPGLRMGFLECGAGWLPYWMWRLDEAVEGEASDFAHLSLTPTEYVERQCFVSIDTDEEPGMFAIDSLRVPHVVWGSDYPHHDSKFPNAIKTLSSLPGMDDGKLRNVLNDAPVALYGPRVGSSANQGSGA